MGSGFKDFAAGDILTANDVDGYLMRQTVMTFADASARDSALSGVLDEGMVAYLEDTNATTFYDGSAWQDVRGLGGGSAVESPGTFAGGDVLQAAELNTLTQGIIAQAQTVGDFTMTTGGVNITNLTFTIAATRTVLVVGVLELINLRSTTNYVNIRVEDNVPGSGTAIYANMYSLDTNNGFESLVAMRSTTLSAGTYSMYLNGYTNTGTARADGAGAGLRVHGLYVIDGGIV